MDVSSNGPTLDMYAGQINLKIRSNECLLFIPPTTSQECRVPPHHQAPMPLTVRFTQRTIAHAGLRTEASLQLSATTPKLLCDICLDLVDRDEPRKQDHLPQCPSSRLPSCANETPTMRPLDVLSSTFTAITTAINSNQPIPDDSILEGIKSLEHLLKFGPPTSLQLASMDPLSLVKDPDNSWKSHGWSFFLPGSENPDHDKLAIDVMRKVEEEQLSQVNKNYTQSIIAGKVRQTILKENCELSQRFQKIVREAVQKVAPKFLNDDNTFSGTKVLVAKEGEGTQPLHFDSPYWQGIDDEGCVITGLFYADDSDATLLPVFPAHRFPDGMDTDSPAFKARSCLLNKRYFFSAHVPRGTLLLFRHSVPHAGVAATAALRVVMFDMLSKKQQPDAEEQYFEWCYFRDAFGNRSEEYYKSLEKNLHHDPFGRFPKNAKGKAEASATRKWFEARKKELAE